MELSLVPAPAPPVPPSPPAAAEGSAAPDAADPATAAAFAALVAELLLAPPPPAVAVPSDPPSPAPAGAPLGAPLGAPPGDPPAAVPAPPTRTGVCSAAKTANNTPRFAMGEGVSAEDGVEPVDAARPEGLEPVPAGDRRERPALPDRVEGPDPVALADRVERPDRVEQPDRVERADRVEGPDPVAAGSLQPQGPPALRPAAAPTAPAGTAPVAPRPAPVVEQLVDRLGELTATRADGDHEVTVQLDPAELGRVELRVRLHDDRVHVHLGAEERGTADLVRQHLPELRSALEAAGIATGGLDVGDHPGHRPPASDPRPDPSAPDHDPARVAARPTPAVPAPSAAAIPAAGGLDLLL